MENNPIQTMLDEHELIASTESIIEELNGQWNVDAEGYRKKVTDLALFFKEFADGIHHRKEEEVLFPAIKEHPDFVLGELIDELEMHHESFRDYTTELEEALQNDQFESAYGFLKEYCSDLLDHIGAENDELFVLAETLLDEEELETIYFKFKDIDLEMGEERKAELEESIHAMTT